MEKIYLLINFLFIITYTIYKLLYVWSKLYNYIHCIPYINSYMCETNYTISSKMLKCLRTDYFVYTCTCILIPLIQLDKSKVINKLLAIAFLAHLVKGYLSFCHHLASVIRRKLSHLNLPLWNSWTKLNLTWQGWSLGGSLSKLCPTAPPSIPDGCCY
jgi:hypothetical protein